MFNMLQLFILSVLLFGHSVSFLPGGCRPNSCENGLDCKNHYEAKNSTITTFLCNNFESFMVDVFNFESCVVLGHSCDCSTLYPEGCEEIRKRRAISDETVTNQFNCLKDECLNGGDCITNKSNTTFCQCKNGFSGESCEVKEPEITINSCSLSPCFNNGNCSSHNSGYTCTCAKGFFGQNCTQVLDSSKYIATYLSDKAVCDINSCSAKADDGTCNEECNFFACGFDGGDCSAKTKPFEKCPNPEYCSAASKDGICDEACNNEQCLFDGRDCDSAPSVCPHEEYCRKAKNNGICNKQCHTVECGYDEDCKASEHKQMLDGTVDVVVTSQPAEFIPKLNDFLYNMTVLLKVAVVLKNDKNGPMIFKWKNNVTGEQLNISKPAFLATRGARTSGIEGVLVSLQIDSSSCTENCFSDVESVADSIGNAVARKDSLLEDVTIYQAEAIRRNPDPLLPENKINWLAILGVVSFLLIAAVGAVVKQSAVWTPPKENEVVNYVPRDEDKPLVPYGQLILSNSQQKSVYPQLSDLHLQALSNQQIGFPINHQCVNLKAGIQGNTPLHSVVLNSTKNALQVSYDITNLARFGADLNAQNDLGETALHLACRYQKTDTIVQLLSFGADPTIRNKDDSTPLHQAAANNDLRSVEEMLKYESVRKAINEVDSHHRTPLEVSARHDFLSFHVAERLINSGANMDHTGEKCNVAICSRRTALHWAVEAPNIQIMKFLIVRGSNIDARDRKGQTPLFLAAKLDQMEVVKVLIEMGANHEIKDDREIIPAEVAALHKWNDIAEFLAALPQREEPPTIEATPRIPSAKTKKERKRKNTNNLSVSSGIEMTPQMPVKKAKRTAKSKGLTLTPPTSDESASNTPITYGRPSNSSISTPDINPGQLSVNDGYTPQGLNTGYLPSSFEAESPRSTPRPSHENNITEPSEDDIAVNYLMTDYLNNDDKRNYMNL